jgi:hypothetical protein
VGDVKIRRGQNMSFATDEMGHVLGWTHHEKTHGKYNYYALTADTFVFDVPVSAILSALKYMQSGLGSKRDKIKMTYDFKATEVAFFATEGNAETASFPVPVIPHEGSAEQDMSFFVNINHLIAVLGDAKGDRTMLRVALLPKTAQRPKETAMVRTIDTFLMDKDGKVVPGSEESKPEGAFLCQVTRFVPSYT